MDAQGFMLKTLEIGKIYYWNSNSPEFEQGQPVLVVEWDPDPYEQDYTPWKVLIDGETWQIAASEVSEKPKYARKRCS